MAIPKSARAAHIRWLRAQVKSATKDVKNERATPSAHESAMEKLSKYSGQLARQLAAKELDGGGKKKGKRRKKGSRKGRR